MAAIAGGDAGQAKEVALNVDGGAMNAINQVASVVTKRSRFSIFYYMANLISNFFGNHFIAITNLVIVAITYGGEELLEHVYFRCPCDHSLAESFTLSYVFGILFFLWIAGICAYSTTWKVCHGCICCRKCWSSESLCHACFCGPSNCYCYGLSLSVLLKTSVVPAAWLFFVLADGDYFACAYSKSLCNESGTINVTDEYRYWKSKSGMWGYCFLAGFVAAALLLRAIYRCCVSKSFLLHKYISVYKEVEEEEFIKQMPEAAKKQASVVVHSFLKREDLEKEDWEKASEFVVIDENKDEDKNKGEDKKAYYSPLHKLVVKKNMLPEKVTSSAIQTDPVTIQPPPGIAEIQPETNGLLNNARDSQ